MVLLNSNIQYFDMGIISCLYDIPKAFLFSVNEFLLACEAYCPLCLSFAEIFQNVSARWTARTQLLVAGKLANSLPNALAIER